MTDQATPPAPAPNSDRPQVAPDLADDPGTLAEGDFGLKPNMQEALADALDKVWNKDDPGLVVLPDDDPALADGAPASDQSTTPLADTASPPAPASPPDAGPTSSAESGAGGEGALAEGAAPSSPASPAPAPTTQESFDLNKYARDYFGTDLTREQSAELFGLLGGLQAMNPQQRAELDRILAGGQAGQYPASTGQPVQYDTSPRPTPIIGTQPPAEDPAVATLGPRPDADEYLAAQWDLSAKVVRANHDSLSSIQQDIARNTQFQLEQQQQQINREIAEASTAWREQNKVVTDGEYDRLIDEITQSGVFHPLVQRHGVAGATKLALDQAFWANESLRARALANAASGRDPLDPTTPDPNSPVAQQQQTVEQGRQARAGSVAGGGGVAQPPGGAVPKPKTKAERQAAMTAEIAADEAFAT